MGTIGDKGVGEPVARGGRLVEDRVPAVVTHFSTAIGSRRSALSDGAFACGYGRAAHAGNLVSQDAAELGPFSLALRRSLCATAFCAH